MITLTRKPGESIKIRNGETDVPQDLDIKRLVDAARTAGKVLWESKN